MRREDALKLILGDLAELRALLLCRIGSGLGCRVLGFLLVVIHGSAPLPRHSSHLAASVADCGGNQDIFLPAKQSHLLFDKHVGIMEIEPVGNYAIRIKFDDLHDTGLFSWQYLYQLGENQDAIWQAYLDGLEAQGLSREPERRS